MRTRASAQAPCRGRPRLPADPVPVSSTSARAANGSSGGLYDAVGMREVVLAYSRGPGGPILLTRGDLASLDANQAVHDGVVDGVARQLWQEEMDPADASRTHVFCSVFSKLLRSQGPAAVSSMTKRIDIFSMLYWFFFFCHAGNWWTAVLQDVPALKKDLCTTSARAGLPGPPRAKLVYFNTIKGHPHNNQTTTMLLDCVAAEAAARGLRRGQGGRSGREWFRLCLTVVSPSVPQQGPNNDCSLFSLSFFSDFFSCEREQRDGLTVRGSAGAQAWVRIFNQLSRWEVRRVCERFERRAPTSDNDCPADVKMALPMLEPSAHGGAHPPHHLTSATVPPAEECDKLAADVDCGRALIMEEEAVRATPGDEELPQDGGKTRTRDQPVRDERRPGARSRGPTTESVALHPLRADQAAATLSL